MSLRRCAFRHNLTLDGCGLFLRLQDPPLEDQENAGGDVSATAKGPALGEPCAVVPDVGRPAAPPAPVPADEPARFATDALGRR